MLTKEVYRKIAGASKELFLRRKNNITFWAFTSAGVEHETFNKIMSDILENLKKRHELNNYVGVAEYQKNGNVHYHFLFDMPFYDIVDFSSYYVNVGNRYQVTLSNNGIRLPPTGGIVQTSESVTNYICKYMIKAQKEKVKYDARCYFMSRNLLRKDILLSEKEYQQLFYDKKIVGKTNYDYITISYCNRKIDLYDEIRRKRNEERLFYDDFIQKENSKAWWRKAEQGYLDLFGTIEGRKIQREKDNLQFYESLRLEKENEKLERYEKWKEQHREKGQKEHRKKTERHIELIETRRKNRVYRYKYDRNTGEFLGLFQWFDDYNVNKFKKILTESENILQFL